MPIPIEVRTKRLERGGVLDQKGQRADLGEGSRRNKGQSVPMLERQLSEVDLKFRGFVGDKPGILA